MSNETAGMAGGIHGIHALEDVKGWQPHPLGEFGVPIRVAGSILIVTGTAVLLHAFGRFVREGLGTPAPLAPTEHLVVGGLYRYVRNPMYLAVVATIVGRRSRSADSVCSGMRPPCSSSSRYSSMATRSRR